jgi:membrane fusion protein, multidrug efflux system
MKESAKVLLLLVSMLPWFSCGNTSVPDTAAAAAPTASPDANKPPSVPKDDSFVATGPLVVEHQVDVTAQREGVIVSLAVDSGGRVRQGQVLGQLDDRQVSADLEGARAKTRSAQADLKNWQAEAKVLEADLQRAQKMWDAQLITKEQLDHARYKAESDQWDVKRAGEMLVNAQDTERSLELEFEKTRIRAPFSGIVARRYVRVGQQVAHGDRLFWVTETSPLHVKFALPERYLSKIQKGNILEVRAASNPDKQHKAKIVQISPVVDPSSATIEVMAEIIGPVDDLRPGMSASIRLTPVP